MKISILKTNLLPLRWLKSSLRIAIYSALVMLWLWSLGGVLYYPKSIAYGLRTVSLLIVLTAVPWTTYRLHKKWPRFGKFLALFTVWLAVTIGYKFNQPTNDRQWDLSQSVLPQATIEQSQATISGIRAFRFGHDPEFKTYTDQYDLDKLKSVWLGIDRFTSFEPMAHTFLSFEFEPGPHRTNFLTISVETRRETSEKTYSPLRGIYQNYEMIYVVADEQDALALRSGEQTHVVQLYPMKATPDQVRELFLDILGRINRLREHPEHYHTLTNNCTNNLVAHTNTLLTELISAYQRGIIFPGYTDWLVHKLGMIDTELSLDDSRETFRVDQSVKTYDGKIDFSQYIRDREP